MADFLVAVAADAADQEAAGLYAALSARVGWIAPPDSIRIEAHADASLIRSWPQPEHACVVLVGNAARPSDNAACAEAALQRGMALFPVVNDLTRFRALIPERLWPYNGFELKYPEDIAELAGLALECLGLQRGQRKLFISYARIDTSRLANQLREAFTARWYSVFLDTVSIRPGRDFQAELKQQLADSDVFLLLDSEHIGGRPYVLEEIDFATQANIGGVQLVLPDAPAPMRQAMFARIDLAAAGRMQADGTLTDTGLRDVLATVARERTAIQALREREMVKAAESFAARHGASVHERAPRYLELSKSGRTSRLDMALGAPTSLELAAAWIAAGMQTPKCIVYDPLGLTNESADHLEFLGKRFPLELLSIRDTTSWPVWP